MTEGPGMYVIDASEKGGLGRNIAFSEGMCTMATTVAFAEIVPQGGPLLVKTRAITPTDVITPIVYGLIKW